MKAVVLARRGWVSSSAIFGAACAALFGLAPSANAATSPVTFAQFSQSTNSTNANQFQYIDNGPNADAQLVTSNGETRPIPVVFDFLTITGALPSDLQGPQNATLTLTSSTVDPVQTASLFGQTIAAQPISGDGQLVDILTITRDTPAAEGNNTKSILLQVAFTGQLAGLLGTRIPILQGSTTTANIVSYSSDFLNFSDTAQNDYNIAFSSWNTTSDNNGLELSGTQGDHFFATGTAAGAGTFDSNFTPTVFFPEPGSLSMLAVGACALLARRRRAVKTVTPII